MCARPPPGGLCTPPSGLPCSGLAAFEIPTDSCFPRSHLHFLPRRLPHSDLYATKKRTRTISSTEAVLNADDCSIAFSASRWSGPASLQASSLASGLSKSKTLPRSLSSYNPDQSTPPIPRTSLPWASPFFLMPVTARRMKTRLKAHSPPSNPTHLLQTLQRCRWCTTPGAGPAPAPPPSPHVVQVAATPPRSPPVACSPHQRAASAEQLYHTRTRPQRELVFSGQPACVHTLPTAAHLCKPFSL